MFLKSFSSQSGESDTAMQVGAGCVLFLMLASAVASMIPSGCKKDVPEANAAQSAIEKLDRGLPLTEREKNELEERLNATRQKEIEDIERRNGLR